MRPRTAAEETASSRSGRGAAISASKRARSSVAFDWSRVNRLALSLTKLGIGVEQEVNRIR